MKFLKSDQKKARLRDSLLFFFLPPRCPVCKAYGTRLLCPTCREQLKEAFHPHSFLASGGNGYADGMFTLFHYRERTVKHLLRDWKRENYRDLPLIFDPYVKMLVQKKLLPGKIHRITYLPRRKPTRFKTGFDQAEQIGALFAKSINLPLEALLQRQGNAKVQHKQKYKHREKNVRGAFRATQPLAGETVLVIDDIVTTGATAREGARILKRAGAMKVYVLSLAH